MDRGDAGAYRALPDYQRSIAMNHRRMTYPHARYIGDRVMSTNRHRPDLDAEITQARPLCLIQFVLLRQPTRSLRTCRVRTAGAVNSTIETLIPTAENRPGTP